MCKQATCPLVGHIVLGSISIATILGACFSAWFKADVKFEWYCDFSWQSTDACSYCTETLRIHMLYRDSESECWDGNHPYSWEDQCSWGYNDAGSACDVWRPAFSLHIIAIILMVVALATGCSQACGCCCPGTKINLQCSFGFTVASVLLLLLGFIMFSTVKDNPLGDEGLHYTEVPEFGFAEGWGSSLVSMLLIIAATVLVAIATFCQPVPMENGAGAPGGQVTVVGKPVEA
mmetsp:Transcript_46518/g.85237  ORF Transcript_46518/g.85237 Transcript_46518/m.85237 type:complete len:233 (+) Transcript_46518:92-790(+)